MPQIEKAGAIVLGISRDKPETLKKWQEKLELPFDLMSDPDHEVLEAYGAWGAKKMYGKTIYGVIRSHYVIDEKSKLIAAKHKVKSDSTAAWALETLSG